MAEIGKKKEKEKEKEKSKDQPKNPSEDISKKEKSKDPAKNPLEDISKKEKWRESVDELLKKKVVGVFDSALKKDKTKESSEPKSEKVQRPEDFKSRGTERGIESLSRGVLRTQLALTAIADNKAALMISINGLIISLIVLSSTLLVSQNEYIAIPLFIWLGFSLGAMVLAIISARPRFFLKKRLNEENFFSHGANILYFGDMVKLDRETYVRSVFHVLSDQHLLYQQIFSHSHGLALSLERKYRILRMSYAVFLSGLLVASVTFAATMILSPSQAPEPSLQPLNGGELKSSSFKPMTQFQLINVAEASAVRQLQDGRFVFASDEKEDFLKVFKLSAAGTLIPNTIKPASKEIKSKLGEIRDVESLAVASDGSIFALGSHSVLESGDEREKRDRLARIVISGDEIVSFEWVGNLLPPMLKSLSEKFGKNVAREDINIEGLSFDRERKEILIGFRTPLFENSAMALAISNPIEIFEKKEDPKARILYEVKMEGTGIRDMVYSNYLKGFIIIGQTEGRSVNPLFSKAETALWLWTPGFKARKLTVSGFKGKLGNLEGITEFEIGSNRGLLLVEDSGNKQSRYIRISYDQIH